jgi:hypothetical protein
MNTLKRCPRCKGWMTLNRDYYGWYQECLQCSFYCDIDEKIIAAKRKYNIKNENELMKILPYLI